MNFSTFHTPVFDQHSIHQLIDAINGQLDGTGVYFWAQATGTGAGVYEDEEVGIGTVILLVSFDFSYYHQAEIVFHGVTAHNLYDEIWSDAHQKQLSLLPDSEKTKAIGALGPAAAGTHCFVCFDGSGDQYYVAAKGLSWHRGMVYYHNRKLKEGERLARFAR